MKLCKEQIESMKCMLSALELHQKYPEEFDNTVGATFVGIAENAAETITNVHELVQFQKVLNMSIDEHPLIRGKAIAKEIIEKVLYKKEV